MLWFPAGDYQVALDGGRVVCRNAAGRLLKSVPAKLSDDPAVVGLRQLTDWLGQHEQQCLTDVERWMVRSLPVPVAVIAEVWPDPSWQSVLRDLVVTDEDGEVTGFLRDADGARGGLGLVALDGGAVRIMRGLVRVPHPVLLDDLERLREFAVEQGVSQGTEQLFREVWHRPTDPDPDDEQVDTYAGARFEDRSSLHGRVISLGYRIRGGQAIRPVFEGGRTVEARIWIGDFDPYDDYSEVKTEPLTWSDTAGRAMGCGQVGPVAWSEGLRMAAAIHAGRDFKNGVQAA